ncbi:MAG: tetratricopeptide repeat protein [Candidatus Neomarinimicrobiota bacterium]|nr:tetratricopeptide repeat protein [Candidatus Neomarinimicrobiota bacterium]
MYLIPDRIIPLWLSMGLAFCLTACSVKPVAEPEETTTTAQSEEVEEVNTKALQHFMDGEMFLSQGNFPMAVIEFQDALRYDPGSSSIHTSLAEVYVRLRKLDRAEESLMEALRLDRSNVEARELLAQQYLMRNQIDKGLEQYQILEEDHPGQRQYGYIVGEILSRKGDLEAAQKKLWSVYEKNNLELQALMRAAEISRQRKDLEFSWQAYSILTKEKPENIQYWKAYSELAVMLQKFDHAVNGLNRLAALTSDDPAVQERLAILFFENNEIESADSLFSVLYAEGTRTPGILYYLGRIAIGESDYSRLTQLATEQVDFFPEEVSGYTNLAVGYINLDNLLDAIAILLKARDKFPQNFGVNYLLGSTYSMEKKYELAKKSLRAALTIDPRSRSTKHLLATVFNYLEEWTDSDEMYEELISSDQNDGQALNNYSYTLAERGIKLSSALDMAQKAVNLEPENPAYLDTIGWIYYKLNKYEKALGYIEQSVSRNSENPVVLEHLGDVLMKVERPEDARVYYRKALEIDADNVRLQERLKE